MDNNNRVPLILFSGGLDSSFLLQEELKKGDVEVLYVTGVLHQDKVKMEEERRAKIIDILEETTGNRVRKRHRIDLGIMPFGNMEDSSFTQPPMWLMGALMVSDSRRHSKLLIAYVSGDQIMPQLAHIQAAWDQLQHISKAHDNIPVDFPYRFDSKIYVMEGLHPEVARLVWYCEMPQTRYTQTVRQLLGLRDDEEIPDTYYNAKYKQEPHSVIRPCNMCEACHRMQATYFLWNRKRSGRYWKHLLRELKSHRRQKAIQEEIKSQQSTSDTPLCPSDSSLSLIETSSPGPCSSELVELEVMQSSVGTSG